jgi:hypothetical protein
MAAVDPRCFLAGLVAIAMLAACSPGTTDYWSDAGMDSGDTDTDTDTDTDSDSDTDTTECEEDGSTECGDGGDTDTWDPDSGDFCDSPEFQTFLETDGYVFDNDNAPALGNVIDPDVEITTFSFFYCPHCSTAAEMVIDLLADPDYGDRSGYFFRNYVYDMNPPSIGCTAHRAAWAAHQQGLFWPMHDGIFGSGEASLTEEELASIAASVGCDMEQFDLDYVAAATLEALQADKDQGQDAGVSGTPSIFVDGVKIAPWDALPLVLDCLLGYAD